MDEKEQLEIDSKLSQLEIVHIGTNKDQISIDIGRLASIFQDPSKETIKKIKHITSIPKKTKKDAITESLKNNIYSTNDEMRVCYCEWIDSVMDKGGWMSKESVMSAQSVVDDFAKGNLDLALKIIKIATANGYRDMTWAINLFNTNYKKNFYEQQQKLHPVDLFTERETLVKDEVF